MEIFGIVVARSCSFLNMASTSALVKYWDGSSDCMVGLFAAEELLALAGVVPWAASSTTGSTTGGTGVDTGGWVAWFPARRSMAPWMASRGAIVERSLRSTDERMSWYDG